jgi:hypothetical protein
MSKDKPGQGKDPIPEFASRQEEAEFWDTHDFGDYWDDWQPVSVAERTAGALKSERGSLTPAQEQDEFEQGAAEEANSRGS